MPFFNYPFEGVPRRTDLSMGLFRLIFLGLIVWLIYRFIRFVIPPANETPARPSKTATQREGDGRQGGTIDTMVRCAQCGLHVPRGEAVKDGDRYFCSAEHRDRHRRG